MFAAYALATERNVMKVRRDVPLELLSPSAVASTMVGMRAIMAARVAGCAAIIGTDIRSNWLELARELGATRA